MKEAMRRMDRLREVMAREGLQGFYTEDAVNIRYLTGFFAPESALVVTPGEAVFVTDFRTMKDAEESLPGFVLAEVDQGAGTLAEACRRISALGPDRVGFESHLLAYRTGRVLIEAIGEGQAVPRAGLVELLRARKDPGEVDTMRRALRAAEGAWEDLRTELRPGQSEKEINDRLESLIRARGAVKGAFDFCVLAGDKAALPHGEPCPDRILARGEPLLVDFGAVVDGYHCDLTRMVYTAPPADEQRRIHELAAEAQAEAIRAVRPGVRASDVDRAARETIEKGGYGEAFRHGLGHGVGLQVHEAPRISWLGEAVLEPGMVFTVEPGIYLPGFGGVRIEDMVLVTEGGVETLSRLPSDIESSLL